jgi:hypothetical protein
MHHMHERAAGRRNPRGTDVKAFKLGIMRAWRFFSNLRASAANRAHCRARIRSTA